MGRGRGSDGTATTARGKRQRKKGPPEGNPPIARMSAGVSEDIPASRKPIQLARCCSLCWQTVNVFLCSVAANKSTGETHLPPPTLLPAAPPLPPPNCQGVKAKRKKFSPFAEQSPSARLSVCRSVGRSLLSLSLSLSLSLGLPLCLRLTTVCRRQFVGCEAFMSYSELQ